MARPQSESDFPGKGRWLVHNQSPSAAKRRKQVGVSITACWVPLRPDSGGQFCSVQSLNIPPTEQVICFCCAAGGCSAHKAAAVWTPHRVQRAETPGSLDTNCRIRPKVCFQSQQWVVFNLKKKYFLYFITSTELLSTILASIRCDQVWWQWMPNILYIMWAKCLENKYNSSWFISFFFSFPSPGFRVQYMKRLKISFVRMHQFSLQKRYTTMYFQRN